jgi:thiosulfate/3-mercaptopyruvate sulfurtransferase
MAHDAPPRSPAPSAHGRRRFLTTFGALGVVATLVACDRNPSGSGVTAGGPAESKKAPLLPPSDLNGRLADVKAGKIAVLHVGPQILWKRERVPGSRWVGEAGKSEGLAAFEAAVKALPADVEVVAYCGCCPTEDCPNVRPARRALAERAKGSVLDLPTNFRTDWIDKGFSVERG